MDILSNTAPIEIINLTPFNPLISKCQIKVCWVGQQPNRNGSIITKEVATEMANSLPGSPIVGYYNEETGDFEQHNKIIQLSADGKITLQPSTKPYGFVDLGAKVWFQLFLDKDNVTREYLVTEGWLWTGQFPECQRVIDKGNNHSMELDENTLKAHWAKVENGYQEFFIINEAIISKLCILGEEYEPCFEGADITAPKIQFSFDNNFKEQMFSMMTEIKNILDKGGVNKMAENNLEEPVAIEEPVQEEPVVEEPVAEEPASEPESESVASYNLEDVVEYAELVAKYNNLTIEVDALNAKIDTLTAEKEALESYNKELVSFKAAIEKKEKEQMINSFYMLSDEDKKDVIENIDAYSLNDIEAKLSILCVRNKVSFDLEDNKQTDPISYNLHEEGSSSNDIPEWIKAIQDHVAEN